MQTHFQTISSYSTKQVDCRKFILSNVIYCESINLNLNYMDGTVCIIIHLFN